jgi:hypothetical protein
MAATSLEQSGEHIYVGVNGQRFFLWRDHTLVSRDVIPNTRLFTRALTGYASVDIFVAQLTGCVFRARAGVGTTVHIGHRNDASHEQHLDASFSISRGRVSTARGPTPRPKETNR